MRSRIPAAAQAAAEAKLNREDNMKKKSLALALALIMLLGVLSACGNAHTMAKDMARYICCSAY